MYSIGAGVDIDPHLTDFYSEKIKEVIYEFERKYDDKQKDPDYLWVILLQYKMYRKSNYFMDTITFRHAVASGRVLFGSLHGMAEKFRDGELIEPDPVIAAELDRLYIRDLKEHCSDGYSKYNKDLI